MAIKIKPPPRVFGSLSFRKNIPGKRIASVMQQAKYKGQLYSFNYQSRGSMFTSKGKLRRRHDHQPLLLLAYKRGKKVWKAGNGLSFIYGFNLNYLNNKTRLGVVKAMIDAVAENPGGFFTYDEIRNQLSLSTEKEIRIFRMYDVRGSKLRYLKQVDLNTYASYLENEIDFRRD